MTDTKELLANLMALRKRLDPAHIASMSMLAPVQTIAEQVEQGSAQSRLIETALRSAELNDSTAPTPPTVRLTARGVRLIRKGRELLQALRTVSDDAGFRKIEEPDPLLNLHHEAVAALEVLLRTVQSFPAAVSEQVRMCDGLEVVLRDAEERTTLLCGNLAHRKQEIARIAELADFMMALATTQVGSLAPLRALAERIVAEAHAEAPLRIVYASPHDPARFAAAHGLTTAHIIARLLRHDSEWKQALPLAIITTLLHDVGMVRVPAEILLTPGPLDDDARRLVEKHTTAAESILAPLWPGGGSPIDAAVHHHERIDGTGYPVGMTHLEQSPFIRLLAVCDVYAALCAPRPHRPAHDTRTALTEVLVQAERGILDQKSAERLLALSFYPIGSVVELNDGSIGIVLVTHSGPPGLANPARPIVHLIAGAQGQPMHFPMVIDLLDQRERSIARSLSAEERRNWLGKKYPQLI